MKKITKDELWDKVTEIALGSNLTIGQLDKIVDLLGEVEIEKAPKLPEKITAEEMEPLAQERRIAEKVNQLIDYLKANKPPR